MRKLIPFLVILTFTSCYKRSSHNDIFKEVKQKKTSKKKVEPQDDDNQIIVHKTRTLRLKAEVTGLLVNPQPKGILLKPNRQIFRLNMTSIGGTTWVSEIDYRARGARDPMFYQEDYVTIGHDVMPLVDESLDFGFYVDLHGTGSAKSNWGMINRKCPGHQTPGGLIEYCKGKKCPTPIKKKKSADAKAKADR